MRSVRCKACGTKALMAASQCPKCGELFEVRDGFGELLPLAYCSTCESYYPESLGACRWCGTKPDRAPIAPHVWKGVGVAACVVLLGVGWLTRESRPRHAPSTRSTASRKVDSAGSSRRYRRHTDDDPECGRERHGECRSARADRAKCIRSVAGGAAEPTARRRRVTGILGICHEYAGRGTAKNANANIVRAVGIVGCQDVGRRPRRREQDVAHRGVRWAPARAFSWGRRAIRGDESERGESPVGWNRDRRLPALAHRRRQAWPSGERRHFSPGFNTRTDFT